MEHNDALMGKVLAFGTCGCSVEGAGTLQDPVRIIYCQDHQAPAPPETFGILEPRPLETSVTLHHKLGLPDYSSVEASMRVMGITRETTDEEVEEMAAKAKIAWSIMGPAVTRQVKAAREKAGW
jgi:hypothetical protein